IVELSKQDRPTHRESVVAFPLGIPDVLASLGWVIRDRGSVREGRTRIQKLVHEVFVRAPMELISPRFHRVIEVPASRLSILAGIIARLYGSFLDGVDTHLANLVILPKHTIRCILPLDSNGVRTAWHPINSKCVVVRKRRARQQCDRLQRISNVAEAPYTRQ